MTAFFYTRHKKIKMGAMTDLAVMGLLLGQCIGRWANSSTGRPRRRDHAALAGCACGPAPRSISRSIPRFFYESLWNLIGLR